MTRHDEGLALVDVRERLVLPEVADFGGLGGSELGEVEGISLAPALRLKRPTTLDPSFRSRAQISSGP